MCFFVVVVSLVFFLTLMPLSRCARVTAADTDLFPRTQFKLPGSRIPGTHTRISAFHIYRPRFFPLLCQFLTKIIIVIVTVCARASRHLLRMMTFKVFRRVGKGLCLYNLRGFYVLVCRITLFRVSFGVLGINF